METVCGRYIANYHDLGLSVNRNLYFNAFSSSAFSGPRKIQVETQTTAHEQVWKIPGYHIQQKIGMGGVGDHVELLAWERGIAR